MASDGEGESEMSWYAEVILSHIIIEKQSDMERRHGSPRIVTSLSFIQSLSPVRSFEERLMVMAEKNKNLRVRSAICPEKNACVMVCCKQKSTNDIVEVDPFRKIKRTSGINELPWI